MMGGHPLISSDHTSIRTRVRLRNTFVFGTKCSSSVPSEAETDGYLNDACESDPNDLLTSTKIKTKKDLIKDEKISQKILKCYQFQLQEKYARLHRKIKRKKFTFLQKHKEFDPRSSVCKSYKTSVIHKVLESFKWHKETTHELKQEIKRILEDVQKRVNDRYVIKLAKILEEYQTRIGKHKFDIGCIPEIEYKIKMNEGVKPRAVKNRPKPYEHEEEIKKTLNVLLEHGMISPYEGPWASEAFVVYNGDGTTRMVCNYKWINAHSQSDSYPTSSVPDMLNKFGGKTIYSSFDINKAFFNIKVAEDSKKYTAFTTKYGTFVWNVMPFGGKNSPATWARASDIVFKECVDLIKYVDDLIIASKAENGKSEEENHLIGIRAFFDACMKNNIKIKLSKCAFFVKEVKFLGNIITPEGRRVDDTYVKKLLEFSHPESRPELRAHLGAIEWISKHVYGFRKLMQPLRPLLKTKSPWQWGPKHQEAFNSIQNIISKSEMLHHPDFNEPFYLFCDASKYYYGAVLFQKRFGKYVIIDMYSKSWTGRNLNKHITTKELLALVDSVKVWKHYLQTNMFYIQSDSKNLEYLFKRTESRRSNNKMHNQWVILLSQFSFEVRFIKGIHNKIADYLSRYIKNPEALKNFEEGTNPLAEYNEHKRMKFHWTKRRKVPKSSKHIMYLKTTVPTLFKSGILPFDTEKDREIAMLSLKDSEYYQYFQGDRAYKRWRQIMPEELDTNDLLYGFQHQHSLINHIKREPKEHVFHRYGTRSKTNPKQPKPDYVSEKHFKNPVTCIPKKNRVNNTINIEDRA